MDKGDAIRIRVFDSAGRHPEVERNFQALDMVAMSAIEAGIDMGRRIEIERVRDTHAEAGNGVR